MEKIFGFNADDLAANQKGQLSLSQITKLVRRLFLRIDFLVFVFIGLVLFVLFLATRNTASTGWSLFLLFGALFMSFGWLRSLLMTTLDILGGRVERVEASFTKREKLLYRSYTGRAMVYRLVVVDGRTKPFDISRLQYKELPASGYFEMYYAPFTRTILSIQAIEEPVNPVTEYPQQSTTDYHIDGNPLAPIFQFTQDDLDLNRQGFLSDAQSDILRRTRGTTAMGDGTVQVYHGKFQKWEDVGMKGNKLYYLKHKDTNFRLLESQYTQLDKSYRNATFYAVSNKKFIVSGEL